MPLPSALVYPVAHLRLLPAFFFSVDSPPLNLRILKVTNAKSSFISKSFQTPGLRASFSRKSRGLACRAIPSEDAAARGIREPVEEVEGCDGVEGDRLSVRIENPNLPMGIRMYRMSLGDQAFFLLAFIACTTSIAFTSLVIAAVPTLLAMKRAATSLAKLADTAREELPSTMAAVRLSGMEISDLTLELSDLSQEIADGVSKSAQAVQAAEAGIRQIGALARRQTISMIQERASLPNISLQPVVAGAARKTSNVVGQARKSFMNLISRGGEDSLNEEQGSEKVEC